MKKTSETGALSSLESLLSLESLVRAFFPC